MKRASLVIPCYNEAGNLAALFRACSALIERWNIEVIVVNNGSTDDSNQRIALLSLHHPDIRVVTLEKNVGYGHGIYEGLKVASGDILGWTHADMQTDPSDFIKGVSFFQRFGCNIFVKGRRYGRNFSDNLFSFGMSVFETALFMRIMWEINAQPTLISKAFFDTLRDPPTDFSFDLFIYHSALQSDLPVYRFPVMFGKRVYGLSSWNIGWRSRLRFIARTIKYSLELRSKYKK